METNCRGAIRTLSNMWVKVFKNGPSKICGRQSLKNLFKLQTFERLPSANSTWSIIDYHDLYVIKIFHKNS